MTANRSAGRIDDELWDAFVARCRSRGLTNTEVMRWMIRQWLYPDTAEPAPPAAGEEDAGPPGW